MRGSFTRRLPANKNQPPHSRAQQRATRTARGRGSGRNQLQGKHAPSRGRQGPDLLDFASAAINLSTPLREKHSQSGYRSPVWLFGYRSRIVENLTLSMADSTPPGRSRIPKIRNRRRNTISSEAPIFFSFSDRGRPDCYLPGNGSPSAFPHGREGVSLDGQQETTGLFLW